MPKVSIRRQQILSHAALAWTVQVEKVLSEVRGTSISLYYLAEQHRYRLLTLKAWCLRYKVSLRFILSTLFWYYRRMIKGGRYTTGLGIPITVLCSHRSETFLEESILRSFPNGENIWEWRQRQRHKMMPAPLPIRRSDDVSEFLKRYTAWVGSARNAYDLQAERMQRRPWRDNPWR